METGVLPCGRVDFLGWTKVGRGCEGSRRILTQLSFCGSVAGTSKPHLNDNASGSGSRGVVVEGVGERPVLYEMSEGTLPQSLPDCPGHWVITSYSSGVLVWAQAMALWVVLGWVRALLSCGR